MDNLLGNPVIVILFVIVLALNAFRLSQKALRRRPKYQPKRKSFTKEYGKYHQLSDRPEMYDDGRAYDDDQPEENDERRE